jgi:hypothetical protein
MRMRSLGELAVSPAMFCPGNVEAHVRKAGKASTANLDGALGGKAVKKASMIGL